jgi:molecular chaperone DnaK
MQEDAEKYAEEDKKKRDTAEIKNNIDSGIWSAEQQLNEHKNNISNELFKKINDQINEAKAAKNLNDIEKMKETNDKLQKILMKMGEEIYSKKKSSEPEEKNNNNKKKN